MILPTPIEIPSPPRQDATAQLLMLLARDVLTPAVRARAEALIPEIGDWQEFAKLAHGNFSLPFAYRHLDALGLTTIQPELMAMLRGLTFRTTMANLRWHNALQTFHEVCILPVKARHAYIKGPALAARYYRDPGIRQCRDVDVLVLPEDFPAVARRAFAQGYRFIEAYESELKFTSDPQDIAFMLRHADVISMLDAEGHLFELHRHIEKMTPVFPVQDVIAHRGETQLGRSTLSVMATDWLFNYIAYHHSRHFWSKLHWVADLHAIMSHPSFDRDQILSLARNIGICSTVEATLEFAALSEQPERWSEALAGRSHGAIFLDACLRGLPGDSAYEFDRWKDMFLFDFEATWQIDAGRKHRFWVGSALRRLEPNTSQYFERRRSRPFEFLYVLENAKALSLNLLKRATGR